MILPGTISGGWTFRRIFRPGIEREADDERGALALPFALRLDGAAVQLDEVARDREAETEPAVRARERGIGLAEFVEHVREKARRNADAGVRDSQLRVARDGARVDPHGAAARRELDRIRQQVAEHLLHAQR